MPGLAILTNKWTYILAMFLLLAAWGGWNKWDALSLENKNLQLTTQVAKLKDDVAAEATKNKLQQLAINALEATAEMNRRINQAEGEVLKQIQEAPEADDGPVAPVLRRTLDAMDKVTGAK